LPIAPLHELFVAAIVPILAATASTMSEDGLAVSQHSHRSCRVIDFTGEQKRMDSPKSSNKHSAVGGAMAEVTYHVALPFVAGEDGVAAGEPTECSNPVAVVMRADALSRKEGYVGAVAFSRTGDPATGDFGDAKVLRKFGDVPNDLRTL
jgi:hypothetical protein